MTSDLTKALLAGILGTAVMSVLLFLGGLAGMPAMNPAEMLSGMIGIPIAAGWLLHFVTGIVFALGYVFLFRRLVAKISSVILKGTLFGIAAFIVAQVAIPILEAMTGPMAPMEGSMMMVVIGSVVGHCCIWDCCGAGCSQREVRSLERPTKVEDLQAFRGRR